MSFVDRMERQLDHTRWQARGAGADLPTAALPALGRIEVVLDPLLHHLRVNPPTVDEEVAVEGLLGDYLPTTLARYINLNPQFARTHRADGRTPGDDLVDQLETLRVAAVETSTAVYSHDAQELQAQGRFLQTKFERLDLSP